MVILPPVVFGGCVGVSAAATVASVAAAALSAAALSAAALSAAALSAAALSAADDAAAVDAVDAAASAVGTGAVLNTIEMGRDGILINDNTWLYDQSPTCLSLISSSFQPGFIGL